MARLRRSRGRMQFPWAEASAGVLVGLAIGATVTIAAGPILGGVRSPSVPFPDAWTYRFTGPALLAAAAIGIVLLALGFVWRADRQFFNYALIGTGLGVLLPGTGYLAAERVEVGPDAVVHQSWWGLSRVELAFADLKQVRAVNHHRPLRRNSHWQSLHYQTLDGRRGTLCGDTKRSRLFDRAALHLLHSAARHGVEVKQEHDYGK